jgi:hypothetical protein
MRDSRVAKKYFSLYNLDITHKIIIKEEENIMSAQAKKQNQTKSKSNILMYLILVVAVGIIGAYWFTTKDESAETYKIRSTSGDDFFHEKSYINLTGKATEEKKIKLSEDYWTKGKFDVK